jgi:hypothetical protein
LIGHRNRVRLHGAHDLVRFGLLDTRVVGVLEQAAQFARPQVDAVGIVVCLVAIIDGYHDFVRMAQGVADNLHLNAGERRELSLLARGDFHVIEEEVLVATLIL